MESEDDLDILTALLAESEGIGEEQESQEHADDLDGLFDEENDEEYKEGVEEEERNVDEMLELFGDVDDIKQEEKDKESEGDRENLNKSKEDLQAPAASHSRPAAAASAVQPKAPSYPSLPKDVALEKYSGLRLRKPRVSSSEMDRKMADRRLIRLSQLPERMAREKLEDSDWVTFAVLVNKATPQSNSSGKTFSIWKLNDLHNLEVFVSLFLFGEVHKEHWKTETGTVVGLLNPNSMKQKEGYDGVSLTVDHPQKVLLMGEAQDYGICKGVKRNGEPCSQIVNMYECPYCQYHVKAQYKKMSSKRAELQSSFSGRAPSKVMGKGKAGGLRERICQDGFYYGGVSSAACAASLTASKPNKPTQKTLDKLFVRGSAQLGQDCLMSPKAASEVPTASQSPAAPHTPTLGRGFSKGDDILFFDTSPPPAPSPSTLNLSAAKLAALKRLRAKDTGLVKEDPNAVKRKRSDSSEINARVERNRTSPSASANEEEEPVQKKKREQLDYVQSEEFQKILKAKSRHGIILQAAEYQLQERYFSVLVKKEQMEEKMRNIREMKCRAVTCKKCSYTYFKPADRCVEENHDLRWHEAMKRFFKCPCGQRAIALDRLPHKHCSNCGLFKWERDGMLKEKTGPKLGGELLLPRGEEHAKFLNSMK
ncbi:protein MCM10 homolog [Neolamprologus brichardi]|nr:protein MCM10 homolog [Neolamprologus brichardi]